MLLDAFRHVGQLWGGFVRFSFLLALEVSVPVRCLLGPAIDHSGHKFSRLPLNFNVIEL